MAECIFCKIISGEIPSEKIYENDKIMAFLDISPINLGHTLVIPKAHFETIAEMPDNILAELMAKTKMLSTAITKATKADGFNIGINNGKAAGQLVPHSHLHIIPRFKEDGLKSWPGKTYAEGESKTIAEKIKKELM